MSDRVTFRMGREEYGDMLGFMERHGIRTVSEMVRLAVEHAVSEDRVLPADTRMVVRRRSTDEILRSQCTGTMLWCMRARRRGGLTLGQMERLDAVEEACMAYLEYRRDGTDGKEEM